MRAKFELEEVNERETQSGRDLDPLRVSFQNTDKHDLTIERVCPASTGFFMTASSLAFPVCVVDYCQCWQDVLHLGFIVLASYSANDFKITPSFPPAINAFQRIQNLVRLISCGEVVNTSLVFDFPDIYRLNFAVETSSFSILQDVHTSFRVGCQKV